MKQPIIHQVVSQINSGARVWQACVGSGNHTLMPNVRSITRIWLHASCGLHYAFRSAALPPGDHRDRRFGETCRLSDGCVDDAGLPQFLDMAQHKRAGTNPRQSPARCLAPPRTSAGVGGAAGNTMATAQIAVPRRRSANRTPMEATSSGDSRSLQRTTARAPE